MERSRIVIIGSGNVATHLAHALDEKNHVVQIMSRNFNHAATLAGTLRDATPVNNFDQIATDAQFYIISVSDDSISEVASKLPKSEGIVAHTSGSVGMEILKVTGDNYGVFYPLQTFSKNADLDLSDVPFFIEATSDNTLSKLFNLASTISRRVLQADSAQRATLHIAAVFGCNFVNHLLHISSKILENDGYTLDVLHPLLNETIRKAFSTTPYQAQTGPAVRGDTTVISKHLSRLSQDKAEIYRILSNDIQTTHNHQNTTHK